MAISTREALFLGNFADADTDESSNAAENTGIYSGIFGSEGDPLGHRELNITYDDVDNNGNISTDNSGTPETLSYDLGAGTITAQVDSLAVVTLDVTYIDGTTGSYSNVVMFQDTTGNLFLTNSSFAGTDLNTPSLIESINVTTVNNTNYTGLFQNNLQDFVCYVSGTQIGTPAGTQRIENLAVGDLISTQDHGYQPIRWIKGETVRSAHKLTPVRIRAGALGQGLPKQDLVVSQQHRIMVSSPVLGRMTGEVEAFVVAKKLVGLPGIELDEQPFVVTYFHIMCDSHEIIFAEGAPSETLHPGPEAIKMMGSEARAELLSIFPTLLEDSVNVSLARAELKGPKLRNFIQRHLMNDKDLLAA